MKCMPLVRSRPEKHPALVAAKFKGPGQKGCALETMHGQDADRIGADAKESGMPQADHTPETKHQIQADSGQRINQNSAEK